MRAPRIRTLSLALAILVGASLPALACMEPLEVKRAREIALLDTAFKTFTLSPAQREQAAALRERSEALHRSKDFGPAMQLRADALIAVGYRIGERPPEPTGSHALHTWGVSRCLGNAVVWVAPQS